MSSEFRYYSQDIALDILEQALDDLLNAIIAYDDGQCGAFPKSRHAINTPFEREEGPSLLDHRALDIKKLLNNPPADADTWIGRFSETPIRTALEMGIQRIGEMLWDIFHSVNEMLDIAERVCKKPLPYSHTHDPFSLKMGIVNATWHGVGYWIA